MVTIRFSLGDTGLSITFVRYRSANNLQISENGAGNFEDLYSAGGTYENRQFHIQVDAAGTLVTLEASAIEAAGSAANRIRWTLTAQQRTDLQSLDEDDRWILFITEPTVFPDRDVAGEAETGSPEATAAAEAVDINQDAAGAAETGSPEVSAAAEAVDINRDAAGSAETGSPEATASADVPAVIDRDAAASAETGSPEAVAAAETVAVPPKDAAGTAETGSPEATATAGAEAVVNRDAAGCSRDRGPGGLRIRRRGGHHSGSRRHLSRGGTPLSGIYRSQDGGATWGPLIAPPSGQTGMFRVLLSMRATAISGWRGKSLAASTARRTAVRHGVR